MGYTAVQQHLEQRHREMKIPNKDRRKISQSFHATKQQENERNRKMNVVPGVHTSLISAYTIEDSGYITVLDKHGLKIYNGATCKI